jgi:hypothetical protein
MLYFNHLIDEKQRKAEKRAGTIYGFNVRRK